MPKPLGKGLGKGLDALIPKTRQESAGYAAPDAAFTPGQAIQTPEHAQAGPAIMAKLSKIEPNRAQPRKNFDEDSLLELSESIKQFGVLQPLVVQDRDSYYEIIAGERRFKAARMAGLTQVPVIVKHYSEQEIVEISLIENIQRADLNPIEEALAYKRLIDEFGLKQDDIAEKVSKSRVAITNSMRLLKLCGTVREMLIEDLISAGHARALIPVENEEKQIELAQLIVDERLSVREVEKLIKKLGKPDSKKPNKITPKSLVLIYEKMEEDLRRSLGTKVSINSGTNGAGKFEISFASHEDCERIFEQMKGD